MNPIYITAGSTILGIFLSTYLNSFLNLRNENKKFENEIRKTLLNKRLESAEKFLSHYTFYVDSVTKLSFMLKNMNDIDLNQLFNTLSEIDTISDSFKLSVSQVCIYFNLDNDIISSNESIELIKIQNAIRSNSKMHLSTKDQKYFDARKRNFEELATFFETHSEEGKVLIKSIKIKIANDLK